MVTVHYYYKWPLWNDKFCGIWRFFPKYNAPVNATIPDFNIYFKGILVPSKPVQTQRRNSAGETGK
jgi:hypothetical protein